jgi:hypothetical protein
MVFVELIGSFSRHHLTVSILNSAAAWLPQALLTTTFTSTVNELGNLLSCPRHAHEIF